MLARTDEDALDSGPKRTAPARLCAVSREVRPVEDLIRFVVAPDGAVVPDIKRNLPGRGLWVCADRETVGLAVKRKLFAKGFKREVRADSDLVELTEGLLERAALDGLSIAGKAGEVVTGFAKVEAALARGGVIGLLQARDGSLEGARKLAAILRRGGEEAQPETPIIRDFSGAQLDLALGRSNVIHAALLAGPASQGFLTRCLRLQRFRTGDMSKPVRSRASAKHASETGPKGTDSHE